MKCKQLLTKAINAVPEVVLVVVTVLIYWIGVGVIAAAVNLFR